MIDALVSLLTVFGIGTASYAAVALGLMASDRPIKDLRGEGLDFSRLPPSAAPIPLTSYTARDGSALPLRHQPCNGAPLLIMVHGSGWHGAQFESLTRRIAKTGLAEVLVPDLRGHGEAPSRRGDIDYINQLEDDLVDLVKAHRKPGQKLILLGHSSGGGLVIRAAAGGLKGQIDHAVLLAPFLKYNAPTARASSAWARPLTRRIIGLSLYNLVRDFDHNFRICIQFRFPDAVLNGPLGHTATRAYSYRMMVGFAPRSAYLNDIAALPDFTLIAGENDEAFHANRYEKTMAPVTARGRYQLVAGVGHLGIVDAPETYATISKVLAR
ncbi:MAG: alpha/beta fold hydrolase [Rhodobacteraceae bacterium]|nr:alpha/beta fold hydrolase [Paracoccaceae bacterium]